MTTLTRAAEGVHRRRVRLGTDLLIEVRIIAAKSVCQIGGVGHDVHRSQQCRRDHTKLVDLPIGSHTPAVTGEFAFAETDFAQKLFGCLVFVLAVGEQDRVGERLRALSGHRPRCASQVPIAVPLRDAGRPLRVRPLPWSRHRPRRDDRLRETLHEPCRYRRRW